MNSPSEAAGVRVSLMGLACFLWSQGHQITGTKWNKNVCEWTFQDDPALQKHQTEYHSGKALVDPRVYFPKVTEFKRMVYRDKPEQPEQ